MKKILIVLLSLLLFSSSVLAEDIYIQSHKGSGGGLTNVTDCGTYTTLQACVDAAGAGGYAYIPPGTYTAGIALTPAHNGLTIQGAGYGSYIHVATGSGVSLTGTSGTRAQNISINNLRLRSDDITTRVCYSGGACSAAAGIYLIYADNNLLNLLFFDGSPSASMMFDDSSYNKIANCNSQNGAVDSSSGYRADIAIFDINSNSRRNTFQNNTVITTTGTRAFGLMGLWDSTDSDYSAYNLYVGNNISAPNTTAFYVSNGYHTFSVNNIHHSAYAIYSDAAFINGTGNTFEFITTEAIHSMDANGIIANNIFNKNTVDIATYPWFWAQVSNNLHLGAAGNIETDGGHVTWFGNMTTIITGTAGEPTTSTNWHDAASNKFANVQVGDLLSIPQFGFGPYIITKIVDNNNLTVWPMMRYFPYSPQASAPYYIYRRVSVFNPDGHLILGKDAFVKGGHQPNEYIIPSAVTMGSVAAVNATPTAAGSGYTNGDLCMIGTGSGPYTGGGGDAIVKVVTTGGGGTVTAVTLVDSGSYGYTVGTGKATTKIDPARPPSGSGLTVEITTVGLSVTQVSDTILVNTGQAAADITNYLPTAKSGYKFRSCVITPQTNHFWAFNNNSGILNNASGDVTALAGSDGTAGSTHGIKFGSGATNLVKGDCADFWTANINATNGYYQWFVQKVVGTTTITAY